MSAAFRRAVLSLVILAMLAVVGVAHLLAALHRWAVRL